MTKPDFNNVIESKKELATIIESMGEYIKANIDDVYFRNVMIYRIHYIYKRLINAYYYEYSSWGDDLNDEYLKLSEKIDNLLLEMQKIVVDKAFKSKLDKEKDK